MYKKRHTMKIISISAPINNQAFFGSLLLLTGLLFLFGFSSSPLLAVESVEQVGNQEITVYKTESCGCCTKWVEHLEASGFQVKIESVVETSTINAALGIPPQLASCHTAVADGYWIEGHVPVDLVQKLLSEKPTGIKGISVPGMPAGSPGMESPYPVSYQVLSVDDKGTVGVYATRDGKSQP